MPVYKDCVLETSLTNGTGTLALSGPVAGFTTFALAGVANGDTIEYAIRHEEFDTTQWEVGRGIYLSAGGGSIQRVQVTQSSAGNGNLVNFSSGIKDVALVISSLFLNELQPFNELVQDTMNVAFSAGTHSNITITYNDAANSFSFAGSAPYNNENAQDAVGGILTNTTTIGFVYNDATNQITANVNANSVSNPFLANMFAHTVKGATSAGIPQDLSIDNVLDWIGTTRGSHIYRGNSTWLILPPGTAGFVLTSNGAGADPSWQAIPGGGGGFTGTVGD